MSNTIEKSSITLVACMGCYIRSHYSVYIFYASQFYMASSSSDHHLQAKPILSDDEWKAKLSDEEYRVLRAKATEVAHTGQYNKHFEEGTYACAGCGHPVYK
jgi:hypothetical protein